MLSSKELEARIEQANQLLKNRDLPPKERLRIAQLRLLDQKRLALRKKHPELDRPVVTH